MEYTSRAGNINLRNRHLGSLQGESRAQKRERWALGLQALIPRGSSASTLFKDPNEG